MTPRGCYNPRRVADDAPEPDPRIGTVLQGRYKVVSRLSQGGMGTVYRGERLQLGRAVAIKFLHTAFVNEKEFLRRFDVEARAMSRLGHPHCVSVIDFGVDDVPYVIMEYVAGTTLRDVMDAGPMPTWRALVIGRQLLAGLAHAHKQNIVHRDVKPANVMLTEATGMGDHVRILDFGLAKLRDGNSEDSATAPLAIGTPAYMSPEQARGGRVDARSDVYSAGVLLFEMLAGKKPFFADEPFALLRMHMEDPAPSLIKAAPTAGLSVQLDAVIRKSMAKAPEDRYQTAAEFAEALEATPDAKNLFGRRQAEIAAGLADPSAIGFGGDDGASLMTGRSGTRGAKRTAIMAGIALVVAGGGVAAWKVSQRETPAPAAKVASPSRDAGHAMAAKPTPDASAAAAVPVPVAVDAPIDAGAAVAIASPDAGGEDLPDPTPPPEDVTEQQIDSATHPATAAEPAPSRPVKTINDAIALIKEDKRDEAIAGLRALRRASPKNGAVHYLLGNLYFDKLWWSDALDSYRAAIRGTGSFRAASSLNRNTIRALGYAKTYGKASSLLAEIGKPALPYLDRAAKSDKSGTVRARAAALAKAIRRRRR